MITANMRYGALAAKVRAMYGKRLRFSDFEAMAALHTEAEVLEYLRTQPGWAAAVASLGGSYVGRVELEGALGQALWQAYSGRSHFVPKGARALVAFPQRLAELDEIMFALRRMKAKGHVKPPSESLYLPKTKVDRKALATCTDYDGLLAAAKESIYLPSLLHLRPDTAGALPDYATTEALLHAAYYSHMYKVIDKQYGGETKSVLLRAFGEEIDRLNLIHILRLKTYFPGDSRYYSALFPFHYRLKPEKIKALCDASDVNEVFSLIRETPYASDFSDLSLGEVERRYRQSFYTFQKRLLVTGTPGVYTAMAYLNIKELELRALVNVIESVKYGAPYHAEFARLIGA
ncbi:MAG: V-type ATPase subunit [Pseudoflavonifractor sp.]